MGEVVLRCVSRFAHGQQPFHNLRRVIAFNPAINAASATAAIDKLNVFRHYFRRRWLGSLLNKQRLFPDLYLICATGQDAADLGK